MSRQKKQKRTEEDARRFADNFDYYLEIRTKKKGRASFLELVAFMSLALELYSASKLIDTPPPDFSQGRPPGTPEDVERANRCFYIGLGYTTGLGMAAASELMAKGIPAAEAIKL